MKKLMLIFALCTLTTTPVIATEKGFSNGLGVGIQYGGIVGWQAAYVSDKSRLRFSLGYAGYTFGYDHKITPKVSLGGQLFANQYKFGGGLSANYYLNSEMRHGWVFGLDVYRGVDTTNAIIDFFAGVFDFDDDFTDAVTDEKPENGVIVSLGYHF